MALTKVNRGGLNTGISDSSDATFLTVDSSEQAVIKGEGTASTSLQQGSAKVWCNYDGSGTAQIDDSINTASITDGGTGTHTVTFTNSMANLQTARPTGSGSPSGQTIGIRQAETFNASQFFAETYYGTNTIADFPSMSFAILGDLA